ncbi:hypothetical protein SAMN04487950_2385 [Halogranum rubrum]|uniref:Uncharacterized protein n=1 Tax=Halogranum rubrum TaxID=553466 RepID=A0A1I4ET85_9EURY|nr:hypothetical protein [Halogranum rubrum]SFL08914.1 hypothetical protein SAMN04487950_2385 [Halogranum rubrum]
MQPSRRTLLGALGTSVLALSAGCAGSLPASDDSTAVDQTAAADRIAADPSATFEVRLHGPDTDHLLFDGEDLERVGPVESSRAGAAALPVALTESATADVAETVRSAGVSENVDAFEIVQTYDGEEMGRFGIAPSLADAIATDEWDGQIYLSFAERAQAERVRDAFVASDQT